MRFGAKAAPGDVGAMRRLPHAEFVETVLQGDDLVDERALQRTARAFDGLDVVVHVPFTVPDGPEVDVAARDPRLREASLGMWTASMELAERLDARWVVLHPGGIVPPDVAPDRLGPLRADALQATEEALTDLGKRFGKERILVENLPAHYHRADGTTDHCLTGIAPLDLMQWADLVGGFCLDTSHAWLTPGAGRNLDALLQRMGPRIRHLHVSDARAPDHEGLQIGDGDIPWDRLRRQVAALEHEHGSLTAVPEVKGGHEEEGSGFRIALDQLATFFQ